MSVAIRGACLQPLRAFEWAMASNIKILGGLKRGAHPWTREKELLNVPKWPWVGFSLKGFAPRLKERFWDPKAARDRGPWVTSRNQRASCRGLSDGAYCWPWVADIMAPSFISKGVIIKVTKSWQWLPADILLVISKSLVHKQGWFDTNKR